MQSSCAKCIYKQEKECFLVMTFPLLCYTVIVNDDDNAIVISRNCQLQTNIATAYIHILLNAIITYKNMFPFLAFDILFCVLHNF